jgi:hypothetical protein
MRCGMHFQGGQKYMSFFGKKRKKFMQEFFNDAFDVFEEAEKRFEKMTEATEASDEKKMDKLHEKKNEAE